MVMSPIGALFLHLLLPLAGGGEDAPGWARFRGPGGSGVAPDGASLPSRLEPGENLRWRTALGPGHSSPCVVADRIFLTEAAGDRLSTVALDRGTGEVL